MKDFNIYVTEKLRVNKNTKIKWSEELENVQIIIYKYLVDHSWFDEKKSDFKFPINDDGTISLFYPKGKLSIAEALRKTIGKNICKEIEEELDLEYAWDLDDDRGEIIFMNVNKH